MATIDDDEAAAALLRRRAAGTLWVPVTGSSMGASIVTGSLVRVVPAARPRFGEVWAFVLDGQVMVHRCVGRSRPTGARFRGDARWHDDEPVPSLHLIGRVTKVEGGSEPPARVRRRRIGVIVRSSRRWLGRRRETLRKDHSTPPSADR